MPTTIFAPITKPTNASALAEKHPFGVSVPGFHTALGIEVDPAEVNNLPLLAVVTGKIAVHRDPPTSPTVTVTLLGLLPTQRDLNKVAGQNVILFVYRNLMAQSVLDALKPNLLAWIDAVKAETNQAPSLADTQAGLFAGRVFPAARAGDRIGTIAPSTDPAVKPYFEFEIDYLPNGLFGEDGFKRAVAIIDPANTTTRRLNPALFLERVRAGAHPELVLAPAHVGHPLFTTISQHVLVEVRNEYNEPFAGVLDVLVNGARFSMNVQPGDRGMLRFAGGATYGVDLADRVFTELPSGRSAQAAPSLALTVPAHWQLQYVYMQDKDDAENWFVKTPSALPRFTSGNLVRPILDGIPTFREIVAAIKTTNDSSHFLRFANWFMASKLHLIPKDKKSSLRQLLSGVAKKGVQTTALIWTGTARTNLWNAKSSRYINSRLKDSGGNRVGFSILDNTHLPLGSHHHKFLVVNGAQGAVAFCGGIDYRENRLNDERHIAKEGYHDTHSRVEGPAVRDLHTTFIERWNNHPNVTTPGSKLPALTDIAAPPAAGSQFVQVTHTYAPRFHYPFRPAGELGTLNALRRAIQRAKRFIYFEDQYVVPFAGTQPDASDDTLGIITDLLAALDRIEFLLIVLPNHSGAPYNRQYRFQAIRALRQKGGNKVRVFYLARPEFSSASAVDVPTEDPDEPGDPDDVAPPPESEEYDELEFELLGQGTGVQPMGGSGKGKYRNEIFVHSKVWVIDDVYAKIGTANVNRRSTTFDSEVDMHIIDGALDRGVRAAALGLRIACWAEHLRMGGQLASLDDPVYALRFWDALHGGRIVKYNEADEGGSTPLTPGQRSRFDSIVDPDGR